LPQLKNTKLIKNQNGTETGHFWDRNGTNQNLFMNFV